MKKLNFKKTSGALCAVFTVFMAGKAVHEYPEVMSDYRSTEAYSDVNLLRINLVMDQAANNLGIEDSYTFKSRKAMALQNMYGHLDAYTLSGILIDGTNVTKSDAFDEIKRADEEIIRYYKHNWRCFSYTVVDNYTSTAFWDAMKFKDVHTDEYKKQLANESIEKGMTSCGVSSTLGIKALDMNMMLRN